ncbi:MAG: hypothetical protein IID16_02180 [Candidatus Marinimicrobia bacterium]|nr:hypothetical protein [Candidatus Neomarinimicrobiota bacterium]
MSEISTLEDYLHLYGDKFETRDIGHMVRSLVYFEDAESEPDIRMLVPLSWQSLKVDIGKWVKDLARIEDGRAKK